MKGTIVIAAAGTGGHIYPGLALADAIKRIAPDRPILFTGTPKGLESTLVPQAGYPLELYPMTQFTGKQIAATPFVLPPSTWKARRILKNANAAVAVTMGGYGGLPLAFGSRLAHVPLAIHESGAVAGRANVLAARVTDNIALTFESAAKDFKGKHPITMGMPLSADIDGFDRAALRPGARAAYGLSDDQVMILVVGGSQGSRTLNNAAIGLAERWASGAHARPNVRIVLKTGKKLEDEVSDARAGRNTGEILRAQAYLDRMDEAYAAADIMISRCGAGSVCEIATVGLPTVFVPYPSAVDDHQALNAAPLLDAGGATLVRDADATPERLAADVEPLIDDPALRAARAAAAASVGHPHAAETIARWVLGLASDATPDERTETEAANR